MLYFTLFDQIQKCVCIDKNVIYLNSIIIENDNIDGTGQYIQNTNATLGTKPKETY